MAPSMGSRRASGRKGRRCRGKMVGKEELTYMRSTSTSGTLGKSKFPSMGSRAYCKGEMENKAKLKGNQKEEKEKQLIATGR